MTDLDKLARGLTEAAEPNQNYDRELKHIFGHPWDYSADWPHGEPTARAYTASIDAALTLVPEGCGYLVGIREDGPAAVILNNRPVSWVFATTPALALCAAALKAHIERTDQ